MQRQTRLRRCLVAGLAVAVLGLAGPCAPALAAAPLRVVYPGAASVADLRASYYLKLLELALHKSGVPFAMRAYGQVMVSPRVVSIIEADGALDLTWGPTTPELEQRLLPVRIPIDKGLLGWRLLLIRSDERAAFAAVRTRAQLALLAAGQQRDWSDTAVLRANRMQVMTATLYEPMFQMLASGRFAYFPRGVGEIWDERERHAALDLEVEPHLALHYPSVSYFFVSRRNPALAQALERGLRAALKDGSFDALFKQYNGAAIVRAGLGSRTVFELANPLLPEAARLQWREEILPRQR